MELFGTDTVQDILQSIRFFLQKLGFFQTIIEVVQSKKVYIGKAKSHFKKHQMQLHLKADPFLSLKESFAALYCHLSNM